MCNHKIVLCSCAQSPLSVLDYVGSLKFAQ